MKKVVAKKAKKTTFKKVPPTTKGKTTKHMVPVMNKGKREDVYATFYPSRNAFDFMPDLKEFLDEQGLAAHGCPHDLYIDAANWWRDTASDYYSDVYDLDAYGDFLDPWLTFLSAKGHLS
jgi:hypothetical protein